MTTTDLLGRPTTPAEDSLLDVYRTLTRLAADSDLSPCEQANVRAALAHVAVVVTDLGLAYEHLLDVGC